MAWMNCVCEYLYFYTNLDVLMVFQQTAIDDWIEMSRLSFGLLLKCSHHPNPEIVAMATAKLHALLQSRTSQDPQELSYLIFSINKALNTAIEGNNKNNENYKEIFLNKFANNLFYSGSFRTVFFSNACDESIVREISHCTKSECKCTRSATDFCWTHFLP